RPAVSRNTASSVNHQSQLRVPPTPRIASLPNLFDNGKLRPEFCSKVLLPDPGGPITTYHGKAYRLVPPLRFLRKVSTASWKRPCNCARSLAERSLRSPPAAGAPCSLRSLAICLALPRTRICLICSQTAQITTITRITSSRTIGLVSGCDPPKPR